MHRSRGQSPSVAFLDERERAVEAAARERCGRSEEAAVELLEAREAEEAKHAARFVLEKLERAHHASLATCCEREALKAADPNGVSAESDRLHDVRAAIEAAVN